MIIPDIHGQADKLHGLLNHIGWRKSASGWQSSQPNEEIVFLGDFIDRGPNNIDVLATVRSLVDSGKAHAIMGNHELNAVHFHTQHPTTGQPLRDHSDKNCRQHASFLEEIPLGSAKADEAIKWMQSLPMFLEFSDFRVVHACWSGPAIKQLRELTNNGVLTEDQFIRAADKTDPLYHISETITKGPEVALPEGFSFSDKDGNVRQDVRVKWWNDEAESWRDIAMSVPEIDQLPTSGLPKEVSGTTYPSTEKPVFFGHYWLTGTPVLQSSNALCLDYSAGKDGPLIAYRFHGDMTAELDLSNIESAQSNSKPEKHWNPQQSPS